MKASENMTNERLNEALVLVQQIDGIIDSVASNGENDLQDFGRNALYGALTLTRQTLKTLDPAGYK